MGEKKTSRSVQANGQIPAEQPKVYWIFTTALSCVAMMSRSTRDEVLSFTVSLPLSAQSAPTSIFQRQNKVSEQPIKADTKWRGRPVYAVTQQHVCLQSSLHIRGGGRKIDLLSTWQHPSIISCEPWKQRHWQDQTGLPSVASTLRHTWLFFLFFSEAGSVSPPKRLTGAALSGESTRHTHFYLTIYKPGWDIIREFSDGGSRHPACKMWIYVPCTIRHVFII